MGFISLYCYGIVVQEVGFISLYCYGIVVQEVGFISLYCFGFVVQEVGCIFLYCFGLVVQKVGFISLSFYGLVVQEVGFINISLLFWFSSSGSGLYISYSKNKITEFSSFNSYKMCNFVNCLGSEKGAYNPFIVYCLGG